MSRKLTLQEVIDRSNKIHDFKYGYGLVKEYSGNHIKYPFECFVKGHPIFWQTFGNHTHSTKPTGCPTCSGKQKLTLPVMIARANKVHDFKYGYGLIKEYRGTKEKYPIECFVAGHPVFLAGF